MRWIFAEWCTNPFNPETVVSFTLGEPRSLPHSLLPAAQPTCYHARMVGSIRIRPAREFTVDLLSGVMDRAFSDHITGPEEITPEILAHFLWKEGIHMDASRVGLIDDCPLGIAMMAHGGSDLSWQISAPALVHFAPPDRGQGQATRMLSALRSRYPGREWKIVQVCPEAIGRGFFERRGFERETLNQVEMLCPLGGRQ